MKALLIVDMQNDFMEGGALPVSGARSLSTIINQLMSSFPLIIATQDWHPEHHKSFAEQHLGKQEGDIVILHDLEQRLWPVHCVENTPGSELIKELNLAKINKIILKGTDPHIDSYSAFYDNAGRKSTGLISYLRENHVKEIAVVGVATDYCVLYSVLDALDEGFHVTVIQKGCCGLDRTQEAFDRMEKAGAIII